MSNKNIKSYDLPLQKHTNSLLSYISQEQIKEDCPKQISQNLDFPKQIPSNPYAYNHKASINKYFVTQNSPKQQEKDMTPICQFLFGSEFNEDELQRSPQMIKQATFKPKQLKQILQKQKRSSSVNIKRILSTKISAQVDKQNKNPNKNIQNKQNYKKQPTKYQKILDQFFNNKFKKPTSNKIDIQSIPNYLSNFNKSQSERNHINLQTLNFSKKRQLNICQSAKNINYKQCLPINQQIKRSFSQHKFPSNTSNKYNDKPRQSWMTMTFQQRQRQTLTNRSTKQKQGRKLILEQQLNGCTFKPSKIQFKNKIQSNSVSGYAKLYLQKLKKKQNIGNN